MKPLSAFGLLVFALMFFMGGFSSLPAAEGRALNTDRPSKTDGPFTLDAGRTQVEIEFFTRVSDSDGGTRTMSWSAGATYLRWAMTPSLELQIGVQPFARVTVSDVTGRTRTTGFGDTVVRAKYNLWGNDGGETSLGLLPFVKLPTNGHGLGNDFVEPGFSLPFAVNLPCEIQLGLMAKVSRLHDEIGSGWHEGWEFSTVASRTILGPVSGYVELWLGHSTEAGRRDPSTLGLGLAWALNADTQLDLGVNLALNEAADDITLFSGYTHRF